MMDDEDNPHFWLGWLAASLNRICRDAEVPSWQRQQAKRSLKAFLDSPCASEDLNRDLERKTR